MPSDFQRKIVDHDRLLEVVREARAAGKTIVQCHGCFDIVHPGHIRYLEFARQQGDVLIVSLTGDLDVGKGDNRPYIPQEFRAENLAAIMFVDYVHINASPTAEQLLGEVRPDVYVKGREFEGSTDPGFPAEKNAVEGYGGRAHLLGFRNVDLLCPTEREARAMLNDYDSGLATVAWEVLRETQARHIFITLEKRGLLVFERRSQDRDSPVWSSRLKSELLPAFADYAVDHLGCGDALLAASTLTLAAGASLTQSAYLGNAAAAIEAGLLGNHPEDEKQLRDWLRARRELSPPAEIPPPLPRGAAGGSKPEPPAAVRAVARPQ
jgi:rfaE bifunctional protein nucleotidyltransferase chain/domain